MMPSLLVGRRSWRHSGSTLRWADEIGGDQPGDDQPNQRDGQGQRERWGGDRGQHDQHGGRREAGHGPLATVAGDPAVQQPQDDQKQRDRHGQGQRSGPARQAAVAVDGLGDDLEPGPDRGQGGEHQQMPIAPAECRPGEARRPSAAGRSK